MMMYIVPSVARNMASVGANGNLSVLYINLKIILFQYPIYFLV